MSTFELPDLGEGLQEAEIVAWHVTAGDHVVADQPLLSVETDKAVVEIPSPQSGRISELLAAVGEIVEIGAPLVDFSEDVAEDKGTVVGEIAEAPAKPKSGGKAQAKPAAMPPVKASPAVRALARKLDVDLSGIDGSGPHGTITRKDVESATGDRPVTEQMEPLHGVRRAMAVNMARARDEVTPTTVSDDADIDAWAEGTDVTMRLARAIMLACKAEPALNAWYDGSAMVRRLHAQVDLGIAMDTEDGLFVPVLRNIDGRSPDDLRRGLDNMKSDVKARTVPRDEMIGQTITLSNFGMHGGRHASLVVVPPQVSIVGAGRISRQVVATEDGIAVRRVLPLSLTFDHRAVTGGEASRFLAAVIVDLALPN